MTKTKLSSMPKKNKNTNQIDALLTILIFAIMAIIISNPKQFSSGTISGLKLFFYSVFPGLFPFMLLTKLITEIGFLFKITPKLDKFSKAAFGTSGVSLYAFFMSILSGYPIGAKIIADLYQKQLITDEEAKKMSIFCTTSGPIFVIGTIGTMMFQSFKIGVIIYLAHILSSIIMGIGYNLLTKKNSKITTTNTEKQLYFKNIKSENILSNCINQTINSLCVVGAYITIFYLFAELLESFNFITIISNILSHVLSPLNIDKNCIKGFLHGVLEVTRGAKELSLSHSPLSVALCCGAVSFSGISIICQMLAFLKTAKIKAHNFVLSKCVHMILSIFICLLIIVILN